MLNSILKRLFRTDSSAPSRRALIALDGEIARARAKVTLAENRVARLRGIIGEEATTAQDLQDVIAQDEGAGLELYAAGHATPIASLITAADAAAKAAVAARAGLPAAERDLVSANGTVAELEGRKGDLILLSHLVAADAAENQVIEEIRILARGRAG